MNGFALIAVMLACVSAQGEAVHRIEGRLTMPPKKDGQPLTVQIGFHIVDFGRITAREESFDVTAHLELRWHDPRLASETWDGKLWTPRLNFDNAADAPKFHGEPMIEVSPDGDVTSRVTLSGKFSTPLDLLKFPFDRQELVVRISLHDEQSLIRLEPLREQMRMHDDVFLTEWSLVDQTYEVKARQYRPGGGVYSLMDYSVHVRRRSTFYLWRVLLPITLLSLIPTLVFWFEPTNLQPQISTCMATLIAMLAFGYSVDFALPKVAYLTLIDRQAMIGFGFATAATIGVAVVHRAVVNDTLPFALRLQRRLRLLYPALYLFTAAISLAVGHHGT